MIPLTRVAQSISIGNVDQCGFVEKKVSSIYEGHTSPVPMGPYLLAIYGDAQAAGQLMRLIKNFSYMADEISGTLAVYDTGLKEDAELAYHLLSSVGTVSVYFFAHSAYAHEFGLSLVRPAA